MRVLKKELWPHCITLDIDEYDGNMYHIEIWLGETLGSFKDQWNAVYNGNKTDFYFRKGKDALLFALRWQ
jgi:hypothetical protein